LDIHRCDMTLKGTLAMRTLLLLALLGNFSMSTPYATAQSAPETPSKPPMTAADRDKQMAQMQENLKRMEQLMDRIHRTKDLKARHELMDEHAKTMQENMGMMRGMGGPMMMDTMGGGQKGAMGPGMMGGGRMKGDPMAGMDPQQQQDFMQRRMDMMQMMMEQIMRHQLMMQAAPAK
jgi:hypothetical protein